MKFGQVQMDSVCVSSMGGGQTDLLLPSPKGKISSESGFVFFFFFHLLM